MAQYLGHVTQNLGHVRLSILDEADVLRSLLRILPSDYGRHVNDGDARRHLVRDAESLDGVPQQSRKLRGDIVSR